jgi:N-acetylmuramoyl-L-alanine amidase
MVLKDVIQIMRVMQQAVTSIFMRFMNGSLAFLVIPLFIFFYGTDGFSQGQAPVESYRIRRIVIDPGHGGKDPGTMGAVAKEKDIVLGIALKLGHYIEEYLDDVEVLYTRKNDTFIELYKRGEYANKVKADLFISIHANWYKSSSIYGAETYVMGLHTDARNLEVAQKENSVIAFEEDYTINYEGFDPNSAESYIIFSLMQDTFLDQSLELASLIQDQFKNRARRNDRGVRQAGFVVLWNTTMPSVLVETGYVSNPTEERYLNSEAGQEYIASAIFRAFRDYKEQIENKSIIATPPPAPSPIFFKVQIASSRKPIPADSKMFENIDGVEEWLVNDWYKYTVGHSSNYSEMLAYQNTMRERFKGAFLVAVKDGKIIPMSEALKEINE